MKATQGITKAQYAAMSHDERINYQRARLKRKKRQRDRLIFSVALVFLCAVGVTLSLTVFFKIESIDIAGNVRYSNEEIAAASGIALQSNLFLHSPDKTARRIEESLPYVGTAVVRRKLPNRISIEISDTAASIAVPEGEGYTLLDENCKVLEKGAPAYPEGAAVLVGVDTSTLLPGFYITESETEEQKQETTTADEADAALAQTQSGTDNATVLKTLLKLTEAVRESGLEGISEYNLSDINNIRLVYEERMTILLGSATNLPRKLRLGVRTLADENARRPGSTGLMLDLRNPKQAFVRAEDHVTRVNDETTTMANVETTLVQTTAAVG